MKKWIIIILIAASFLISCEKDDYSPYSQGDYYFSIGTIVGDSANFSVRLDNGTILIPSTDDANYLSVENDERVLVEYIILGDIVSEEQNTHHVQITYLYHVLCKDPILITEENIDSLGNDWVDIVDMWIGADYLNVDFRYFGGYKSHLINLGIDSISASKDTAYLDFLHNNQGDYAESYFGAVVSFDLDTLKYEGQDSIVLMIDAMGYNQITNSFTLTYNY